MNINNLIAGTTYKNYKALCEALEMKTQTGNGRKAQFKELERHCKLVKSGHSITVIEIYEEALEKVENRGRSSVYGNMIQFLITDLLARTKKGHLSISRNKLLETVNMINENYGFCSQNVKSLSRYANIEEHIIYDFYNTSNNNFKSAIETTLNNLQDKRVLWYETIIKVRESGIHREATRDEKDIIWACEKEMLNELSYESVSQVRTSKHWGKFKKETAKLIRKQINIDFYYHAYNISINENYISKERDKLMELMLEDSKKDDIKNDLNATVIQHFMKNAENRHDKAFSPKKMGKHRLSEKYTIKIKKLIDLLIDDTQVSIYEPITKNNLTIAEEEIINKELEELFS
ncbi:hypothetical protein GCM10009865_47430 [Aeromicrobium ponti]|uniref:Uncharacterized protein n=1 Tax=Cytobacillus oceanisediminis TaxID=665099 RepID=A0A562JDH8_9BACI|nr:hypothetical protein [Cytobacillus oceanisediminis]TWH81014.1 hypothetical protein IQ19_04431 [Cytobacillus oceanisediminis]